MMTIELEKSMSSSVAEQAIALLDDWYKWSRQWRPALGVPKIAPYCRQSQSGRQYDEDLSFNRAFHHEMELVEWCVGELPVAIQQVIGREMRNRYVGARVWRCKSNLSFDVAINAIVPLMLKKGIIRAA